MKSRIFVAVMTSVAFGQSVLTWKTKHAALPLRWIAPANLHLTLIPPWYATNIKSIQQKLQDLKASRSFSLRFHSVVIGPDTSRPRLIWVVGDRSDDLIRLKQSVEVLFGKIPENRPFSPHITIARTKDGTSLKEKFLSEAIRWNERVVSVSLVESHLSPTGATYTPLVTITL